MTYISVLMVNYNGGEVLLRSLSSLAGAGIDQGSVLLVDNASTDGSHRKALDRFPGLTLLETGGEISFAAANNLGLRELARRGAPEAVLFMNNDAVLEPGCAVTLMKALEKDPDAGAAAPLIYDGKGCVWYAGGGVDWKEAGGRLHGFGREDREGFHQPARVEFATLCVLLVRWTALERTGLLDETYHFYDEDLDFCLRLSREGFSIAYEPGAAAVHLAGYSTSHRGEGFVYHHMARNRLLTMRRYGTPRRWLAFLPWFGAMMSWKAIRFTLRGRPRVAGTIASGLYRGLTDPLETPPLLDGGEGTP